MCGRDYENIIIDEKLEELELERKNKNKRLVDVFLERLVIYSDGQRR